MSYRALAEVIEFAGALIVGYHVLKALAGLAADGSIPAARLAVAEGVLAALGLKLAATLLKALELGGWDAIGRFAAILALRTVIKGLFVWESARLAPDPSSRAFRRPAAGDRPRAARRSAR